ncbi:GreA/GreB family elongation factor [candidate division KSB1 bacterium]
MSVVILINTYDLLLEKIDSIKAEIRANSIKIEKAADFGDLKENAEYKTAKENQEFLFNKLSRFEQYLNCRIVDGKNVNSDTVAFGTSVKIVENKSGIIQKYNILGPVEFELESMPDIVTYTSPLAKMVIGKKIGEEVEIQMRNSVDSLKILEIEPIL